MATYVIGDLQGCYAPLMRLVDRLGLTSDDQLWFAGDLVNRGPDSLKTLRWVRDLGDQAVCVLGNHDLHLLSRAAGHRKRKGLDTLYSILTAPDRDELVAWLRQQPMLHEAHLPEAGHCVMVHAGLHPSWTLETAREAARAAEALVQADPEEVGDLWPGPGRRDAVRMGLKVLATIRVCDASGGLGRHKGPPDEAPAGHQPWYAWPSPRSEEVCILFGHWAAHGLMVTDRLIALDTGCVWGQHLTAVRLEDRTVFQEACGQRGDG